MTDGLGHGEMEELLGAFALDAVDPNDAEQIELHLRDCPRCRAEVTEYREVAAMLAHTGAPAPEGVWGRIVDALEASPPALRMPPPSPGPPSVAAASVPTAPVSDLSQRRARVAVGVMGVLSAAAVVLVVVLGITVARQEDRLDEVQGDLASVSLDRVATDALTAPDAIQTELRSANGDLRAPAVLGADGSGYLLAHRLPNLPEDRTYQLWGLVGDTTISLGVFAGGVPVVPFHTDPEQLSGLAVTEEVAGGVASSDHEAILTGSTT
ncbi:hypothetical protein BH24ACT3_BH24ACT3_05190 [soil metagenome]